MNRTGIDAHLKGLEREKLGPSYWLPREQEERLLYLMCKSIRRVMEKTMAVFKDDQNVEVPTLSVLNARLLNTLARRETSQDPFSRLQNEKSRRKYIATWQQLICYWDRVVEQGQLRDKLFQPSDRQSKAWCEVSGAASEFASATDPDYDEVATQAFRDRLDLLILGYGR